MSFLTNKDRQNTSGILTNDKKIEWRNKIQENADHFVDFCLEVDAMPDIWSIYEWSNWLSPWIFVPRRFDALFFLIFVEDFDQNIFLNTYEMTDFIWKAPEELIEERIKKTIEVSMPQIFEMSRMMQMPSFQQLQEFAKQREKYGLERWMPVINVCKDGIVAALPGDSMYPEAPDANGIQTVVERSEDCAELRQKSQTLFRIEVRDNQYYLYCDRKLACNQLKPLQLNIEDYY